MATCAAAFGKIEMARRKGQAIHPAGALIAKGVPQQILTTP